MNAPKTFKFGDEELLIVESFYSSPPNIALQIIDREGCPYATLTVNLPPLLEDGEFYVKTWSENAEVAEAAMASGLFVDTGKRKATGFVVAEVWRFA